MPCAHHGPGCLVDSQSGCSSWVAPQPALTGRLLCARPRAREGGRTQPESSSPVARAQPRRPPCQPARNQAGRPPCQPARNQAGREVGAGRLGGPWGWGNSARGVLEKGPGGQGGHPQRGLPRHWGVTGALQDTGLRGRPGGPAESCRPGFCQDGCQVAMPGQRLPPEPPLFETKPEMWVLCENSRFLNDGN